MKSLRHAHGLASHAGKLADRTIVACLSPRIFPKSERDRAVANCRSVSDCHLMLSRFKSRDSKLAGTINGTIGNLADNCELISVQALALVTRNLSVDCGPEGIE